MTDVIFANAAMEAITKERLHVKDLGELVKRYGLHQQSRECFWVIGNDRNGDIRTIVEVARGRRNAVSVDIQSAMTVIRRMSASGFSIAHNHLTDSVEPSPADRQLTEGFIDAARTLGLLVEDHVIVESTGRTFSFRRAGIIAERRTTARGRTSSRWSPAASA